MSTQTKEEIKFELIDKVSTWLEKKDANYLSKEGQIVYYASMTGRKSDYKWFRLSLPETVRVVSASELTSDTKSPLKASHVITACQELDRVFEMGIHSRHPTTPEIFNFMDRAHTDLATQIMQALARELYSSGYEAFRRVDMLDIYNKLNTALDLGAAPKAVVDMYWTEFNNMGYEIRDKAHRVQLDGRKQCVFMLSGLKPKDVMVMTEAAKLTIYTKLYTTYK